MPKPRVVEPTRVGFRVALRSIYGDINDGQWAMLRAHFHAPGRELTASKLAREAGYKNYRGANLQYGKLGTLLREALGLPRAQGRSPQLVAFDWIVQWHSDGDYGLRLKPAFVQALTDLKWFGQPVHARYDKPRKRRGR